MVLGSTCQLCHCNDNTDPNMLFTDCHPLTGECLSCMHNTAGPHCDTCAPGYYGDAITAKNCSSEFSAVLRPASFDLFRLFSCSVEASVEDREQHDGFKSFRDGFFLQIKKYFSTSLQNATVLHVAPSHVTLTPDSVAVNLESAGRAVNTVW